MPAGGLQYSEVPQVKVLTKSSKPLYELNSDQLNV